MLSVPIARYTSKYVHLSDLFLLKEISPMARDKMVIEESITSA